MPQKPKLKTAFEILQDKWYAKLKKSGFEDAEKNEYSLYSSSDRFLDPRRIQKKAYNEDYYALCQQFLTDYKFDSKIEEVIWEYHTNGLTVREIADTLRKVKNFKAKSKIHRIVQRLQQIMKRMYFSREF